MQITAIVIGAGGRGNVYSFYAKEEPEKLQIVGVAEPNTYRRTLFQKKYGIPDSKCFDDWKVLKTLDKFADCVFICTQDKDHVEPAIAMAKKGYNILLEKPMAVTPDDCRAIYNASLENDIKLAVCHVLRYNPCVQKLKTFIDSGLIGDVVNINHVEPVGFWHFAHSFVRGNWRNSSKSTFSLLAKCCHDVDLIYYWMNFKKCVAISSFGTLRHFKKENKPEGAGDRCFSCSVEPSCPYSARKIYLESKPTKPVSYYHAVCDIEDSAEGYLFHMEKALQSGPYGRCVYECDNDVCDNQVVNFQFEDGSTATLTMIAFSGEVCQRKTTIYGTKGQLKWDSHTIDHYDFLSRKSETFEFAEPEKEEWESHEGSDYFTVKDFIESLQPGNKDKIVTGAKTTLESHLMTFAAEQSRLTGNVVNPSFDVGWNL